MIVVVVGHDVGIIDAEAVSFVVPRWVVGSAIDEVCITPSKLFSVGLTGDGDFFKGNLTIDIMNIYIAFVDYELHGVNNQKFIEKSGHFSSF